MLTTAPQAPSDSKTQKIENYSPVVDLRSNTRATQYDQTYDNGFDPRANLIFNQNTNVFIGDVTTVQGGDIALKFTANNNALVTMDFDLDRCVNGGGIFQACGGFEGNGGFIAFKGDGKFVINANMHSISNTADPSGFIEIVASDAAYGQENLEVYSSLTFKASGNVGSFLRITQAYEVGNFIFNTPYLEIDMDNNGANKNTQKYFIYTQDHSTLPNLSGYAKIYLNADTTNPQNAYNQSSILKITGNIRSTKNTRLYANFTNSDSFLKGNLELGSGSANITFSNGSSMTGNIDYLSDNMGNHSITFDNASYQGQIKDTQSGKSTNTSVVFKNTAGRTFGNGIDNIVDASYKGAITGTFDVSANSTTIINGGTNGEKGFAGGGTNTLVFDFKGNARNNATTPSFTISGGNANSLYVMSGFQTKGTNELDLSSLEQNTNSLFSKIAKSGIKIQEETKGGNSGHLNGTLLFQRTSIKVGNNDHALFATKDNILATSTNDLNGLALGAMFGNATWNDANKDGAITANEIISNNGVNYKLSNGQSGDSATTDSKTSIGNVGSASDNIKKNIAFIFDNNNSYVFNGDKQGYSGVIAGGTDDSKYYFANAGYIGRTQIENAKGDLVLFNTAFRGDLGVSNKDVSILLDFSGERNGLRAENGVDSFANIVGSGSKNITFNFTGNTKATKYGGAVVGTTASSAKYTMLNLQGSGTNGELQANGANRGSANKTLIDAIRSAGVTGFNDTTANGVDTSYSAPNNGTDIQVFDTSKTTLALRGASLDATNLSFKDYIYDFAFGEGLGEFEGVAIQDSKLKGTIDLTAASATNTNSGHSFVFKGTAIDGNTSGVLATAGKLAGFSYDDSTANYSSPVTFKLSGLAEANYVTANGNGTTVTGDSLIFTKTNLVGNLWADSSVAINLDFTNGRTWKMTNSGFDLASGSNLVINGLVTQESGLDTSTLKVKMQNNLENIELTNTQMDTTFQFTTGYSATLSKTFKLRGTSFTIQGNNANNKRLSGVVGDGVYDLVFAKGANLQTTVSKQSTGSDYANITDKEADTGYLDGKQLSHTGTYKNGVYDGNYIAQSSADLAGINSNSGFDITFIGEDAWTTAEGSISTQNYYGKPSSLTFVNAGTDGSALSAGKIGNFFERGVGVDATIILEGTTLENGNKTNEGIVQRSSAQNNLTFKMTFINEGSSNNNDTTYVGDKYTDLASTTNANGALSDSVLKIAESKLVDGLDFKNANAFVTFVGDGSQSLDGTTLSNVSKILKGGSASSVFTFRDSNLNAGSTASSIQNIKGTIAFDLTHHNEDMEISGTLSNMLASGGKHQVQFTGRGSSADPVTINRLVFVDVSDITSSTTLGKLDDSPTAGQYFNDADTFGSLAQADYSDLALLTTVKDDASSSLTFANDATVALTSGEVVFVGENSHKFDADSSANKLGDSTGGILTFVDAGTLKVDNLINKDASSNTQQGKGTINLIGSTKIEAQSITQGQSTSKNTLSLKKNSSTGEGIIINAVFSANNALADNNNQTISVSSTRSRAGSPTLTGASTYDIGQTGEKTIYHLLFDYTSSNLTFGTHHAYTGNIYGLTSDSVIKFKNAGYIDQSQIENTQATILVDNTQIKGDFRGDSAILDFRNNHPAISGKILTSDKNNTNLSQKTLTFDLTGSTKKTIFSGVIQAGYKVAPSYSATQADLRQSVLTFQNAPVMTLGNDGTTNTNPSDFIKALANDAGFSGIGSAETKDTNFASNQSKAYILEGTKLAFQGTNITADSSKTITENTYFLDLSFDTSATRGTTGLGETLNSSALTANSITMGALSNNGSNPLGLSLSFNGANSLNADSKKLNVKVKENAIFNLNAQGSEKIGTIILSQNNGQNSFATLANVATESSMNISAGSMDFVGQFIQTAPKNGATAGAIDVTFNGANKAYGVIAGKGDMKVTLSGNAIFTNDEAKALGYEKNTTTQFADLVIDLSSSTSSTLSLTHTSGMVGIVGTGTANQYTAVNLNSVGGNIALKGNFDLGRANLSFADGSKVLKLEDDTALKLSANSVLNFQGEELKANKAVTLTLNSSTKSSQIRRDFTFVNIDPNVTVELKSLEADGTPNTNDWGVGGLWNFRGTNLKITSAFWSESNNGDLLQTYVFAKGSGTETNSQDSTKLSMLTTSDKINESALTGELKTLSSGDNVKNLILKNAKMTFIGKESFGIDATNQKIDGTNGKITFGFYNGLIQSGSLVFDNTNNGRHSNLGNSAAIQDVINLSGTDTFNLSVGKMSGTSGANNSTINAVYVNGTTSGSDNSVTGVRYIDASGNHAYASAYATSNAGGALSQTQLKTLESKAYGNITLDNTVTATMKFIGENSHSFDGKTKVDNGNVYYSENGSSWQQYRISDRTTTGETKGAVYLETATTTGGTLATLTGGNANSRFDFDHTTVSLDQIKGAGGSTYVYNSTLKGAINVSNGGTPTIPADSSTTLIFNAKMTKEEASSNRVATATDQTLSLASQAYITNTLESKGINIDFSTAHQMTAENLGNGSTNSKTLANTSKTTNLIFIGKDSVKTDNTTTSNNSGDSIDISFMPDTTLATGYNYTFIDAGDFTEDQVKAKNFGSDPSNSIDKPSGSDMTIFGTNKVVLVNTYVLGARDFAQQGFVDVGESRNQKSTWGGADGIEQFLIFDFQAGKNNNDLKTNNTTGTISNLDPNSRYIFTNMFDANTADSARALTLENSVSLKDAINKKLKSDTANPVIGSAVKGYLGLRGVSIKGNINESTNGVDIVFNSTDNISYIDGFDENGNHTATIQNTGYNKIANAYGINNDKSNISGYAILESSDGNGTTVTISGNANKEITFIGDRAVKGGFDNLKIQKGGVDSTYTFYEVGTLSQTFLTNVGLYNSSQNAQATAGSFTFENVAILDANINVDQNNERSDHSANVLTFKNVDYSGTISGSLKKDLSFGANTDNVKISGGSDDSSYDFSNLAGKSINLGIDMTDAQHSDKYFASSVTGFENGDISLTGSIKLAKNSNETNAGYSYSNSFAFNNDASWSVTDDSRVMNLSLSNSGTNYNIDLASAPRTTTKASGKDLRVLEVGNLTSNNGQVLLGTMIDSNNQSNSKSDRIDASVINGTLYVTAKDASLDKGSFPTDGNNAIVLVTAEASNGEVKGAERKQGLSYVSTVLEHQTSNDSGATWNTVQDESAVSQSDSHRWVLSAFGAETNQELVDESGFIVSNPYRMLMIETNNLNKRMGDLRDDDYNQGAWIRVFNGMDSGEGAKNLYTNIQLGYDYGTPAIGAKNYTGVAFSTSIVDIDGNQYHGKANTYSLGVYNAYIADSGLYVDTIAKYLYTDQKLGVNGGGSDDSFGSHALSLGVEVGYRAYMGETNFYFEPQAEVIGGMIFGVKDINMGVIGGMNVTGELKTTTAINTRVGLVQGYSLKTESGFRADFRLGASLVNEFISESDPVRLSDGITNAGTSIGNDVKVVVNVGTNLILTDQWRVYIDAERSFGGNRNTDYQANVGARFSFGDKLTSLPKPEKPLPLKLKSEEKKEQDKSTVSNTQEAKK